MIYPNFHRTVATAKNDRAEKRENLLSVKQEMLHIKFSFF
jgi:hypothetical protein